MTFSFVKLLLISLLSFFMDMEHPTFKNGGESLHQFLENNMIYPAYSKQNCIEGTIKITFQLNNSGEVVNEKVKSGLGIDLDEEALRLIKLTSNKWIIPEGYHENTEITIPVIFTLKNYGCERKSVQETERAIYAYQTREALENVVTSYYKNKYAGAVNTKNDDEIIDLKTELGFNEELVAEKLSEAKKMLKQGDQQGACNVLYFIKNIGYNDADDLIAKNCK